MMGMTVEANILFDSKNGDLIQYKVKDAESVSDILDEIGVRDSFTIEGIGRLHIRSISTIPLKGDTRRQRVTFRCYWVDTSIPY